MDKGMKNASNAIQGEQGDSGVYLRHVFGLPTRTPLSRLGMPLSGRVSWPACRAVETSWAETGPGSTACPMVQETPLEERTDEALLASHIAGEDADSFEELLGRYVNELIPFLTRLTGSKAAADDVFQETFLQIHQSARTFDPSRRFRPWLYTIAVNKGRDWRRRNARRKAVSLSKTVAQTVMVPAWPTCSPMTARCPDPGWRSPSVWAP